MPEILAPAGNMDMLKAAVINGADAVYLGMSKFSARAKAANFDENELKAAIDFAHLFGVKVYAAINTVIKNEEIPEALSLAETALSLHADAIIVQDFGLCALLRQKFPDAVLHASTQMGIHNLEGAIVAKKLGLSRIILSRETLFEDIVRIKKNVDIELECFVQGALCIAFSGNCYFSSFASGYSGNRGKCMQLCRKIYSAEGAGINKSGYLLSSKDLMLADKIDKLKDVVDCFKIEGRLRRPEYVAEAVRIYKKALNEKVDKNDIDDLKRVFNRGDYTEGHMFVPTNKVLDIDICAHKGLKIGKVLSVGKKAKLSCKLSVGDGVKFLRNGKEVGSASVTISGNETTFTGSVKPGDYVNITTDAEFNRKVLSRTRKLPVKVFADFDSGIFSVSCAGITASLKSDELVPAQKQPITAARLENNFNKSDVFYVKEVGQKGEPSFLPKSIFNSVRRALYDTLQSKIIADYESKMPKFCGTFLNMSDIMNRNIEKVLNGNTIYQVEHADRITDDMQIIAINPRDYSLKAMREFIPYAGRALLNLPVTARGKDIDVLRETIDNIPFSGFIVNNLYGLELVKDRPIILGYGMNMLNDVIDVPKIYSIESDKVLSKGYIYAQGNVPLMNFCHCAKKELANGCENCSGYDITFVYENRRFYLRRYKIHYCYSQLLNCADLNLSLSGKVMVDYSFKRMGLYTKGNYVRGLK